MTGPNQPDPRASGPYGRDNPSGSGGQWPDPTASTPAFDPWSSQAPPQGPPTQGYPAPGQGQPGPGQPAQSYPGPGQHQGQGQGQGQPGQSYPAPGQGQSFPDPGQGYPAQPTYPNQGPPSQSFPTQGGPAGFPQPGAPAYSPAGYPQQGYPPHSQPQPGQPQPGYPQPGYVQPGYVQPGPTGLGGDPGQAYPFSQGGPQPGYPTSSYPAPGQPGSGAPASGDATTPYFPADQTPPTKTKGKGKLRSALGTVAVVAILIAVKVGAGSLLGHDSSSSPSHPVVAAPTSVYERTPAESYPTAAEGIVLPTATAVPGFTVAQVSAALAKVKQGMTAARLDQAMLVGHDPKPLLALIAPDGHKSLDKEFADGKFFPYATQLAPGNTLSSDPIRVKGTITFSGTTSKSIRELDIVTNFVWVYPFSGTLKEPGDHLVVVHDKVTWGFPAEADVDKTSRGMWIMDANAFASNIDCDLLNKSQIALGKPTIRTGPAPTQDDNAPFDPNGSIENLKDTC